MSEQVSAQGSHPSTLRLGSAVAAWLALAAGLITGLVALAGPLAVWLNLADFRWGFARLQTVNTWADWVAIVAVVIAVAVFAIARIKGIAGGNRLAAFALVGAVCAGLSWYIPETFRPPEGTPPIHDIATDPDNPLEYIAIAPLRADAANNMVYGVMPGITPEEHKAAQIEAYPDIVPQRFDVSVQEVYERALRAAESLGWEIVSADPAAGRIEATDTTFWFRFKDDVVIEVTPDGSGSVLNARSLSRVGRGDVGKNAARLRKFFALL